MLRRLFANTENCVEITSLLLKHLGVKVTQSTIQNELQGHPDYPSLLSINDVLRYHNVESLSFKMEADKLFQLPTPFIAQIKKGKLTADLFTVVEAVSDSSLRYFNPESHYWEDTSILSFESMWTSHIVLLPDAENGKEEEKYFSKRKSEQQHQFLYWVALLMIPVITIGISINSLANYGSAAMYSVFFLAAILIGALISTLLTGYEIDRYNPVLQQICGGGKKVNCDAILQSKASKIAGISWSSIGFTYFGGSLLLLLTTGILNSKTLFTLAWINVFALPYTFFSVYYQWQIAKQWCVLCLSIQALLGLQAIITFVAGWHNLITVSSVFFSNYIFSPLLCYLLSAVAISILLPVLRSAKENHRNKAELQRLKHNKQIFEVLLLKQKAIKENVEGLGIILGNPSASTKIIKVCNPYCGPCAKAHIPIDDLLHNNPDIQVQIIFTATNAEGDQKAPPVKHLLAIAEKGTQSDIIRALNEWYLPDKKDYEAFAAKYPMDGELKQQNEKIEAMKNWCEGMEISFTPTFFMNGYQLPDIYTVQDIKYFIS